MVMVIVMVMVMVMLQTNGAKGSASLWEVVKPHPKYIKDSQYRLSTESSLSNTIPNQEKHNAPIESQISIQYLINIVS